MRNYARVAASDWSPTTTRILIAFINQEHCNVNRKFQDFVGKKKRNSGTNKNGKGSVAINRQEVLLNEKAGPNPTFFLLRKVQVHVVICTRYKHVSEPEARLYKHSYRCILNTHNTFLYYFHVEKIGLFNKMFGSTRNTNIGTKWAHCRSKSSFFCLKNLSFVEYRRVTFLFTQLWRKLVYSCWRTEVKTLPTPWLNSDGRAQYHFTSV